jgi:type IV pilus assembly protein PilX
MLTRHCPNGLHERISISRFRQGGVVLMISLIILVALTLGGITLVRSVGTTSMIAGNLAFQQAAMRSAEAGTEDAINSVIAALPQTTLWNDDLTHAYVASTPASGNPASWDAYWRTTINPNPVNTPVAPRTCVDRVCTLPIDAASNTVSYTIQRLCQTSGDPKLVTTGCASGTRKIPLEGEDIRPNAPQFVQVTQYYYRITTRVIGPRNTISYIQTIVAK